MEFVNHVSWIAPAPSAVWSEYWINFNSCTCVANFNLSCGASLHLVDRNALWPTRSSVMWAVGQPRSGFAYQHLGRLWSFWWSWWHPNYSPPSRLNDSVYLGQWYPKGSSFGLLIKGSRISKPSSASIGPLNKTLDSSCSRDGVPGIQPSSFATWRIYDVCPERFSRILHRHEGSRFRLLTWDFRMSYSGVRIPLSIYLVVLKDSNCLEIQVFWQTLCGISESFDVSHTCTSSGATSCKQGARLDPARLDPKQIHFI